MAAQSEVNNGDPPAEPNDTNNNNNNNSNNKNNPMSANLINRLIKCYCNDDALCPRQNPSNTRRTGGGGIDSAGVSQPDRNLVAMLERNRMSDSEPRYCQTSTMCVTKRLEKYSGETWLKYGCDNSQPDSIKSTVLRFRDCRIDATNNEMDRALALKNSEFCCDSGDFCNVELVPTHSSKDLVDFAQNAYNNNNNGGSDLSPHSAGSGHGNSSSSLAPVNLILGCLSLAVFILVIILFVLYLFKKAKLKKDSVADDAKVKPKKPIYQPSLASATGTKSTAVPSSTSSSCSPYSTTTSSSNTTSSSSSSTSTTNTSIMPSKENSVNEAAAAAAAAHMSSVLLTGSAAVGLGGGTVVVGGGSTSLSSSSDMMGSSSHTTAGLIMSSRTMKIYEENNKTGGGARRLVDTEAYQPLLQSREMNAVDENTVIKINSPLSSMQSSSAGFNASSSGTGAAGGGTTSTSSASQSQHTNMTTHTSTSASSSSSSSNQSEFEWSGSGSGAGVPQCVQRTIARQIKLIYPCIGKGRFGEVYKGEWRGELVAVKTFNSADERSWENECQIYQTQGFRHENILGYIAADNIDRGLYTELWLITEFHEMGSLFDYLTANKIGTDLLLKMALSVVNGLVHLHMPIESCKGKPALAHCDLKSKNILVKADLTCCIGDLGLALSGDKDGRLIIPPGGQIRTGTKRYMAPEILSKKIDTRYLDPFQKAEIYSLALIFWELLRACRFETTSDESASSSSSSSSSTRAVYSFEYKLPYFEYLGTMDPDEQVMRQLVCEQHLRPGVSAVWRQGGNAIVREFTALTEELWCDNPNERLNALRIKKSIMKIKNTYNNNNNNNNNNNVTTNTTTTNTAPLL